MCMVFHMAPVKRPVIPMPATFPIPAAHVCMCTQKNIPCPGLRQVRNLSGDFGLSVPLSTRKQENKLSSLEAFGADQGSEMRGLSYSAPYTRLNLDYTHDTSNRPCLLMCAMSSNQGCSKVSFGATIGTYLRSAHEQKLPATSATSVLLQAKQ